MNDEWLIRGTAWLAFAFYIAAEAKKSRVLNSLGCATLLFHIIAAFHCRHGWSHSAAYLDTARQTAALTGWNWGGGIYVNYLFAAVWIWTAARSWLTPSSVSGFRTCIVRGFFLFMFLNAAVVFVSGPMRWLGLVGCVTLVVLWSLPRASFSARS